MSKPVKTIWNQHKWSENEKSEKTIIASTQSSYPCCYQIIKQQIEHNSVIHIRISIHRRERESKWVFACNNGSETSGINPLSNFFGGGRWWEPRWPFSSKKPHSFSARLSLSLTHRWELGKSKVVVVSVTMVKYWGWAVLYVQGAKPSGAGGARILYLWLWGCNIYQGKYWLNGWCSIAKHTRGQFTGCMYWCYVKAKRSYHSLSWYQ